MNCVKVLVLLSLIPLALRGASLLVVPSPSAAHASRHAGGVLPPVQAEQWRQQRRRTAGRQAQARGGRAATIAPFAPRRFGGGFFRDDKRFAPTGSNPLHNL